MSATKHVMIERVTCADGASVREHRGDQVVIEAPLALLARGHRVATIMRTPGHDLELVRGLLRAEALPDAALRWEGEQRGDACVDIDIDPASFAPRATTAAAGCGLCGRQTIADLERVARAVDCDLEVTTEVVVGLPAALFARQAVFAETGGLHAAALATRRGELIVVREDVGRHNAVDKVVGWALEAGAAAASHLLVVSGRLGYEIVQKAVAFGVPVVVAVSAPSSLAIEVAERFRVTLCGFTRRDRFNVYSHPWRIA